MSGASIPLDQFGQRFEHRLEHISLDPSPVTAEDTVPFAVFVRQMPPFRSGRHEVASMIVYICSEQASATSGAALRVDGGVVRFVA